jgi:hypothetical protein
MIPEIAKAELIQKRQAGQTWTGLARWLAEEYGIELHRSTIQRWYDREVVDFDTLLDEAAATMADEIAPEEEEDFIKDRIRLDKRVATYKAESAYYKKLYERVIKDSTRSEILVDTIKRYVTPLKPTKQYPTRKPGSRKRGKASQVMVAPLTDTHVGDNVKKEQTVGLNEYDIELFSRRMWGWSNQVLSLAEYRRNICDVDELVIPMLGDMISGDIHEELARTNIDNCMMQMMYGAKIISQALMFLAPHFEEIRVPCVVGNHGRMTRKIPSKDRFMDWDYMLYQWVAVFVSKQNNIIFEIPKSVSHVSNIANRNILMMHGDSIGGGGTAATILRTVTALRSVLQYKTQLIADDEFNVSSSFDDVLLGHFHRVDEIDIGTGSLHICGTMKGGDEFTISRLNVITKPKQIVLYFHPEYGQVGKEVIYLDRYDNEESEFELELPEVWGNTG